MLNTLISAETGLELQEEEILRRTEWEKGKTPETNFWRGSCAWVARTSVCSEEHRLHQVLRDLGMEMTLLETFVWRIVVTCQCQSIEVLLMLWMFVCSQLSWFRPALWSNPGNTQLGIPPTLPVDNSSDLGQFFSSHDTLVLLLPMKIPSKFTTIPLADISNINRLDREVEWDFQI